jgi:ornithine decarboxylase
LAKAKIGFDCASRREIIAATSVSPSAPIIYANPCKRKDDIAFAGGHGQVRGTTVDSVEELEKLAAVGWPSGVIIRIKVDDEGSLLPFSSKFGTDNPRRIADAAKALGLSVSGISFHVGSGCQNAYQYYKAIQAAYRNLPITQARPIIDIGGGFTGGEAFKQAAQQIRKAQADLDPKGKVEWIAEPGRYFAETSMDLFTQVIGKKKSQEVIKYTIDESLYGQFSCIPYDQAKPKWMRVGTNKRKNAPAVLFGRTCDSVDVIAKAEQAEELEEGDWLWWPNMGAYTTVTATEFNGFPMPLIHSFDTLPGEDFEASMWPTGIKYATPVKSPLRLEETISREHKYA